MKYPDCGVLSPRVPLYKGTSLRDLSKLCVFSVRRNPGYVRPAERKQNWLKGHHFFFNPKVSFVAQTACCPGFPRWRFLSAVDYITLLWLSSQDTERTLATKGVVYSLYQRCAIPKQKRDCSWCSREISRKSSIGTFELGRISTNFLREFWSGHPSPWIFS